MKYLIIYDVEGTIISKMSGNIREPVGIPFIYVDIPEGKSLVKIDTSAEEHQPVFEDMPPTSADIINQQIQEINDRMFMMEELLYTAMEAVVSIYEIVLPFLPN